MQNPNCNPTPYFIEHIKLHIDNCHTVVEISEFNYNSAL